MDLFIIRHLVREMLHGLTVAALTDEVFFSSPAARSPRLFFKCR